jgi:uncharacterized paraquat-inducible protein A
MTTQRMRRRGMKGKMRLLYRMRGLGGRWCPLVVVVVGLVLGLVQTEGMNWVKGMRMA